MAEKFPNSKRIIVGSFLILRYISPALLTPRHYGFRVDEKHESIFMKITKILQVIANQRLFSETSRDSIHNGFIEEITPLFLSIFDKLIDPNTCFSTTLVSKSAPSLSYYSRKIEAPLFKSIYQHFELILSHASKVVRDSFDDPFIVLAFKFYFNPVKVLNRSTNIIN